VYLLALPLRFEIPTFEGAGRLLERRKIDEDYSQSSIHLAVWMEVWPMKWAA
jgi:hypothetical protein